MRNRTHEFPMHCVYVTGNPSSGMLLAYVELFGVIRRVVCLSQKYDSRRMSKLYSINPITGQELQAIQVDPDDSRFFGEITAQTQDGMLAGLNRAFRSVIGAGMNSLDAEN